MEKWKPWRHRKLGGQSCSLRLLYTTERQLQALPAWAASLRGSLQAVAGRERKLREVSCTLLSIRSDPRMLCGSSEPSLGRLCPVPGSDARWGPQHGRAHVNKTHSLGISLSAYKPSRILMGPTILLFISTLPCQQEESQKEKNLETHIQSSPLL